jgi:hypothetical protein
MRLAEAVLRWSAGRKRNREDHRISKLAKEFTPSCPFGVKHIIESKLTIEGAGVKLRRAFATSRARPATMPLGESCVLQAQAHRQESIALV